MGALGAFGRFSEPALLVLVSLSEGAKHGYAVREDVEELAGVRLGPGTLYGAISRLEDQGLIEALTAEDRRKPYRITPKGARVLRGQLEGMRSVVVTGFERLAT